MDKRVVLVLGMHRSGTSALTGLLAALGVPLGDHLLPAVAGENPKGFWEHAGVTSANDRVLQAMGSAWHDARELPANAWSRPELEPLREEIRGIIRSELQGRSLWAVKDPRLCRLLPLWRPLLEEEGCSLAAILIVRNPVEVAQSLEHRNAMAPYRSNLLWLQHVVEAERSTRDIPRVVISYAELLADWKATVDRICEGLSLRLPQSTPEMHRRAEGFIDGSLRHHRMPADDTTTVARLATQCYELFAGQELARFRAAVDDIAREIARIVDGASALLQEAASLMSARDAQRTELRQSRERLDAEIRQLEAEIARVKGTVSWRITGPLRGLWNLLRRLLGT